MNNELAAVCGVLAGYARTRMIEIYQYPVKRVWVSFPKMDESFLPVTPHQLMRVRILLDNHTHIEEDIPVNVARVHKCLAAVPQDPFVLMRMANEFTLSVKGIYEKYVREND